MYKKQSFWSNIIKQSSWYYLCSALNNGLAILLLPFLSRRLSTEEYGIIQLSTGISMFLPMVFLAELIGLYIAFSMSVEPTKQRKS